MRSPPTPADTRVPPLPPPFNRLRNRRIALRTPLRRQPRPQAVPAPPARTKRPHPKVFQPLPVSCLHPRSILRALSSTGLHQPSKEEPRRLPAAGFSTHKTSSTYFVEFTGSEASPSSPEILLPRGSRCVLDKIHLSQQVLLNGPCRCRLDTLLQLQSQRPHPESTHQLAP